MTQLISTQLHDALAYIDGLTTINENLSKEPEWGGGLRLVLPTVIALRPDYDGEEPVAWLVANDFDGYDLSTVDPAVGSTPGGQTL